jgi:PASTA domain
MFELKGKLRIVLLAAAIGAALTGGPASGAASALPPANDGFADGLVLSGDSGGRLDSNVDATKEVGEPAHAGDPGGKSVWYRWTAARDGQAVFSTCGSEFDTVLAVYTGTTVPSLIEVTSSNNDAGCDPSSLVSFRASAGTQYHVAVDGVSAASGALFLDWFQRPANDDRADAQVISGETGSLPVSNAFASLEPNEPAHGGPGGSSVWFRWVAPSSGPARFDTCAGGYDTLLAVYEGGSTTALAANDDYCDYGSLVGFAAEGGKEYFVAVDGYDGEWVEVNLGWNRSQVAPSNLERPVISGNPQEGETLQASEGNWSGTAPFSFSYQWARCDATATSCRTVPGAVGSTYVPGFPDVASRMRVFVTATNGAGSSTTNSVATAPVVPRPHVAPRNTALPTIAGTPVEDATLTATAGAWDGYPAPGFVFQWQTCSAAGAGCADIPGENAPTLTVSPMEVGRRIRVVVTASNPAGAAAEASSLTSVVTGPRPPTRRCVVPKVRGKSIAQARRMLAARRCALGRVTRAYSAKVRRGRIVRQSRRPGIRLPRGTRVHVVVSRGRRR